MPLGTALKVWVEKGRGLLFRIQFTTPDINPFAEQVYRAYLAGLLRATSVGFRPLVDPEPITDEKGRTTGYRFTQKELYELSAVPVPANPEALALAVEKGIFKSAEIDGFSRSIEDWQAGLSRLIPELGSENKGVIPFKSHTTDPPDASWDGGAEVKAASIDDLKEICTWYDSAQADNKGAYKLPHHRAKGYKTVWKGITAGMGRLMQAATQIPEGDRKGCYDHLAGHYKQFDKKPPEFKAAGEYSRVQIFLIARGLSPDLGSDLGLRACNLVEILMDETEAQGAALADLRAGLEESRACHAAGAVPAELKDSIKESLPGMIREALTDTLAPKGAAPEEWLQTWQSCQAFILGLMAQASKQGGGDPLYTMLFDPAFKPEGQELGMEMLGKAAALIGELINKTKS